MTQLGKTLGLGERPLGPATKGWVTSDDMYRAILEGTALSGACPGGLRPESAGIPCGRRPWPGSACQARLPHARRSGDDTHRPLCRCVPAHCECLGASRHARRFRDESRPPTASLQYRHPVIEARGDTRSDEWITFALAERLGLGNHFWNGDADAAYREILEPSGVSLDALQAAPAGHQRGAGNALPAPRSRVAASTPPADAWRSGPNSSRTSARSPLPEYVEPAMSPVTRPDLKEQFPLVLTSAKSHAFCHSQHRNVPSPAQAAARSPRGDASRTPPKHVASANGDRVLPRDTPAGRITVSAPGSDRTSPRTWSRRSTAGGRVARNSASPSARPSATDSTNFNSVIGNEDQDPDQRLGPAPLVPVPGPASPVAGRPVVAHRPRVITVGRDKGPDPDSSAHRPLGYKDSCRGPRPVGVRRRGECRHRVHARESRRARCPAPPNDRNSPQLSGSRTESGGASHRRNRQRLRSVLVLEILEVGA